MKKTFLLLLCLHIAVSLNAQLTVNSNGKVGVNYSSNLSNSLTVGGNSTSFAASIKPTKGNGLYITHGNGAAYRRYGLQIATNLGNDTTAYSIYISQTNGVSNEATYGILSCSGQSSKGSFGVAGGLYGSSSITHGAGIYGSSNAILLPFQQAGIYAGYFKGDVRVTGTLYGTLLTPSGSTNSSNSAGNAVRSFSFDGDESGEKNVSDKLQQVQLLQFYRSPDENKLSEEEIEEQKEALRKARLMEEEEKLDALSASEQSGSVKEEGVALERDEFEDQIEYEVPQTKMSTIRYGFAADQLKEVYPELVYEDENGNVSINYIEMIPLLVQAVNEVKRENASLRKEVSALKGNNSTAAKSKAKFSDASSINSPDEVVLSLGQNRPNPFSSLTCIEVAVPESIKSATLFIYDMSGKQIRRIDIAERGVSQISITSEGLSEGMYLYSLIADGKVVGTKKMFIQ